MTDISEYRNSPNPIVLWAISAAVIMTLGSCSDSATNENREFENVLARVTAVTAPDTVNVGEYFTVTIATGAPDSRWRKGPDEVHAIQGGYWIIPYDQLNVGQEYGYTVVLGFTHEVELILQSTGTAYVHISHRISGATADSIGTIIKEVYAR